MTSTQFELERLPPAICLAIEYGDKEMFETLWNEERPPEEWKLIADQAIRWLHSTVVFSEGDQCIPNESCRQLKRVSVVEQFEGMIEMSLDDEAHGDVYNDGPPTLAAKFDEGWDLKTAWRKYKGNPVREGYFLWALDNELTAAQGYIGYHLSEKADAWLRTERQTSFAKACPADLEAYLKAKREKLLDPRDDAEEILGLPSRDQIELAERALEYDTVSMYNMYEYLKENDLIGDNPMKGFVSA